MTGCDLKLVVAEDRVHGLAGRDVGVEANELVAGERLQVHLGALGERMVRVRDEHQPVVAEGDHLDLALLLREGDETEIHRVWRMSS